MARQGKRLWPCYATLSRPLTIMGVERTWFILSATLALALWNALNAILTALVVFAGLWGAGYLAWKKDPHMLSILKASTRFKARYDPGKWIAEPWRVIVKGRYE